MSVNLFSQIENTCFKTPLQISHLDPVKE